MARSSNSDFMDYYSAGGPGGNAAGMGGLGGSNGGAGRSSGGNRGSTNDYHGQGGPAGNSAGMGGLGGGGYDGPSFSGSGTGFADSNQGGGSSYGMDGAGNVSAAGSGNRGGPSDAGTDNYFGGSPIGVAANQGGLGGSVGRGLGSSRSGFAGNIGGNVGRGLGSRSTYGQSEAGGLSVSGQVGRGLGGGRSLSDVYGQAGRSMAAAGVRGLGAPGAVNISTTSPREVAALMSAIAQWESSKNFSSKYRDRVTDFSDHPRTSKEITSGPNRGKRSSASGAFQFIQRTWDDISTKIGVKDFSPRSQTQAAVALAKQAYDRLGSHANLEAAIEARDFKDISRALGAEWEGVDIRSARSLEQAFDRELASLDPQTVTTRTGANIETAGQVFDTDDGRVATPSQASFTEETSQRAPNNFASQVLGYLDPTYTGLPEDAPSRAGVVDGGSVTVTDEYPTPFNTRSSGFNKDHDLELRVAPANVELEDLPGNEHLSAPSTPSRGLGPSAEPKEPTFEETFLEPDEAAPTNVPTPQQRGDSTIRDVVVPDDWQRPSGDPWAGMREGDVGFGDSPRGDPWEGLRDVMAESGIEALPFKPVAVAVDAALSFIPAIGWVNLGAKLVTGETIGEYVARNGIKTDITFPSVGEPGSDEAPPVYRSGVVEQEPEQESEDETFESIYLSGNGNPTPGIRWGRRAA